MEQISTIEFNISLTPDKLHQFNLKTYLRSMYRQQIYDGVVVREICKIISHNFGNVLNNGQVELHTKATCIIDNPIINQICTLPVTNSNKLGAFCNLDKITVFIPKSFCINQEIPAITELIDVLIIGKRVENKISCIGSCITQVI